MTIDETWIHHVTPESKRSSSEWTATGEPRPKRPKAQQSAGKVILFHQGNAPCHKSIKTMAKLHELHFELLPHSPYSSDLAPCEYWLFADLNKMLAGKKFISNAEAIAETESHF